MDFGIVDFFHLKVRNTFSFGIADFRIRNSENHLALESLTLYPSGQKAFDIGISDFVKSSEKGVDFAFVEFV